MPERATPAPGGTRRTAGQQAGERLAGRGRWANGPARKLGLHTGVHTEMHTMRRLCRQIKECVWVTDP